MTLPITSACAAILGLWLIWLSARVIQVRASEKIMMGDDGNNLLMRRSRAQANLSEYAPMGLILLGLAEIQAANFWLVAICGISLVVGRLLHGYALSFTEHFFFGRFYGMNFTFAAIAVLALTNLYLVFVV